jgi:hypothetical protein
MDDSIEQAVLLCFRFASGQRLGTDAERHALQALEERLQRALDADGTGGLDASEVDDGEARLYLYGPDADALWSLAEAQLPAGGALEPTEVVRRYGAVDDSEALEVVEVLGPA